MAVMRMTQIYIAADLPAAQAHYEQIGLYPRASGDADCVGFFDESDNSRVIVVGDARAARTMPPAAVDVLRRKGGLYVWVDSIEATEISGQILGETETPLGARERFIETEDHLVVLAEKLDHFIEIPPLTN